VTGTANRDTISVRSVTAAESVTAVRTVQFKNSPREGRGFDGSGERKRWNGDFTTTVMGGALRSGGCHDMQDRSRTSSISGQQKMFNKPNVLEHSPENRETVECISQFAMLLGVYNRQSP
jgi:hypothetical protein